MSLSWQQRLPQRRYNMDKTEFLEKLKKASQLQAEKKKEQQERFQALMEKLRAGE